MVYLKNMYGVWIKIEVSVSWIKIIRSQCKSGEAGTNFTVLKETVDIPMSTSGLRIVIEVHIF